MFYLSLFGIFYNNKFHQHRFVVLLKAWPMASWKSLVFKITCHIKKKQQQFFAGWVH